MTPWQRRARLGVALFGIATSVGVYFALGERRKPASAVAPSNLPPNVILEGIGGQAERLRGLKQDYGFSFSRSRTLSDGTVESDDVTIEAANRDGRSFVVPARLAIVTKGNADITLRGSIRLREADGFEMTTEEATFNKDSGLVLAAGPVAFSKG